jgi:hypothetical protein
MNNLQCLGFQFLLRMINGESLQCKAIPTEILDGSHDHREPFPGDSGFPDLTAATNAGGGR